ncbi:MAG: TetM/TetW/TetO/TetS family tetracycline resistance ribosomal protection protein [Clostridia bacterium]|nr:TetM/TetW/TetO/TetS family tetracycline resistance ribosomal protection protein [Clostridia bacterium]
MEIRNIGIFADVDAGKTTLTEQMLSLTGAIRETGSVDSGTAHTDTLPVEKRRGISVRAAAVRMCWKGCRINLVDTPGHADFAAEVEHSLWAMDGAVLLVCACEGVRPQTVTLWRALRQQGIPVVFFISKTDREAADVPRVLDEIRRLCPDTVHVGDRDAIIDRICAVDDFLTEKYLDTGDLDDSEVFPRFYSLCRGGKAFPVTEGSALRNTGVDRLLDLMVSCLPAPGNTGRLCGVVFSVRQDRLLGRGVWVRLYGGSLENRQGVDLPGRLDPLTGKVSVTQQKITQIRSAENDDLGALSAGDIGVVYGLGNVDVGTVLGDRTLLPRHVDPGRFRSPLISVKAIPGDPGKTEELRTACAILSSEDPLLHAEYHRALREQRLNIMGTVQLEILREIFRERFSLDVSFDRPRINYMETLLHPAEGFAAYTMPKPCWAILRFEMKPGKRSGGVTFASTVDHRLIAEPYQNQVRQALPIALSQGRRGWPVTDIDIRLVDGSHHLIHTHPLDFIVATPWAIQDGLQRGGSLLLEPVMDYTFSLPPNILGRVISDTAAMRGEVLSTENESGGVLLRCRVPLFDSVDYPRTLASLSSGRASMSASLHGYRECDRDETLPRRGVDPLDTAKYILAARSALEGGIYDG